MMKEIDTGTVKITNALSHKQTYQRKGVILTGDDHKITIKQLILNCSEVSQSTSY